VAVWAFLADIHGNFRALERAEAQARAFGAERFAVLGDVLGRGHPAACVAWVRHHAELAVVGNRDLDHLQLVDDGLRAFLRGLPKVASTPGFVITHGDARLHGALNSNDERRGWARAYAALAADHQRLWFFGHTHRSAVWRKMAADAPPTRCDANPLDLDLGDPSARYIVNVGSVGRRLAGRGPTSFSLFDSGAGTITHVQL
jgi:predicted phosphodiesterase